MSVKLFGIDTKICPMELLCDNTTGHLSTTKIWQHIGFTAMTYVLVNYMPQTITWEYVALFIAYGAIVASSYVAIRIIKQWGFNKDARNTISSPELDEK